MKASKDRIEKLPKWAQQHISHLNRQIEDLTENIQPLIVEYGKVPVAWRIRGLDKQEHSIPEHACIRFGTGVESIEVWSDSDGGIRISSENNLVLCPRGGANTARAVSVPFNWWKRDHIDPEVYEVARTIVEATRKDS